MKKSSFVAMVLGTVSVVLFALGMCMALIPEWNAFKPGIIFGCVGLVLGLITLIVWRKMEHKQPISINGKTVLTVIVGVMGGTEHKGASAVICGAEVAVQLDAGVSTIATTESVYVTPDGKFSNTDNSGANKQVNATWVDGVVYSDGVVSVGSSKRTNQKCALISFRGGL